MSIRRAPKVETGFYVLDKEISEDSSISWAARGVLIFLLGKPDNWNVSVQHLVNQTADLKTRSTGRDGIRSILAELEAAGYLTRERKRSEGGSFDGVEYVVREKSSPRTANPSPVEPSPANPPLTSTDTQTRTDTQTNSSSTNCGVEKKTCPVSEIVDLYHEILPELPSVALINRDRTQKLQSRWREHKAHQDLEFWREYFTSVKSSAFLMGNVQARAGARPFRATFDWLIAPSNFVKVVEGNYHA